DDLRALLGRSPGYAAQVQQIALTSTFNARLAGRSVAIAPLARLGADADLMIAAAPPLRDSDRRVRGTEVAAYGEAAARALLNLYLAESELEAGEPFAGLD